VDSAFFVTPEEIVKTSFSWTPPKVANRGFGSQTKFHKSRAVRSEFAIHLHQSSDINVGKITSVRDKLTAKVDGAPAEPVFK